MKTERNSAQGRSKKASFDDLWNQRTLSTFTTFARTPDKSPQANGSNDHAIPYNNGNSPHNDSSNCGSSANSSTSSEGSTAPIHDVSNNGSIGGGSRNGTLTRLSGINKAKPVAVPILLSHQQAKQRPKHGHSASLIIENGTTTTNGDRHGSLNSAPSSHSHSHSLSYTSSTDSTVGTDLNAYIPSELDEQVLDVAVGLDKGERRFGFSVIGGRDEGFPPCIDEISPGSPADKADLEVGDEILEVNGRSLEDATHTEVISHIHQCIRSRTICLRVKRRSGNKLALDLASQSNVQDAFVIAVEQQARERLEKLSALKRIKPVDMTKLSHQLSETPSGSGDTSELNGLIEAATGSPIYVTSAAELSGSQVALHPSVSGVVGGEDIGGSGSRGDRSPRHRSSHPPSPGGGSVSNLNSANVNSSSVNNNISIHSNKSPLRTTNGHRNKPSPLSEPSPLHLVKTSLSGSSNINDYSNSPGVVVSSTGGSKLCIAATTDVPNGDGDFSLTCSNLPAKPLISLDGVSLKKSRENLGVSEEEGLERPKSGSPARKSSGNRSSKSSSRESVVDATQYANMINMVEWDSGPHREMAVDVPDSFVPRNKTPPRYPPSKTTTLNSSTTTSSSNNNTKAPKSTSKGNGTATLPGYSGQNGAAGKPVPPPRIGEKDGWNVNNNNTQVPHVPPRTLVCSSVTSSADMSPSRDQEERIRKYQEELKKRREKEERQAKEEEFLRTSLRGSKKLQALEQARRDEDTPSPRSSVEPSGFVNDAYHEEEEGRMGPKVVLQKPVGLEELVGSLQRVQQVLKKNGLNLDETVSVVSSLMQRPEFQQVLAVHNKVQDVWCFNPPPTPVSTHARQLLQECLGSLYNCSVPESAELVDLLSRVDFDGVLYAHDKISERERLLVPTEAPHNAGESVDDDVIVPQKASSRPAYVPEPQPDDRIKVVRIEKTQDPLGATVRNDGEAVVIGRIVKGGAAERSGLLHEGDEILEVNGLEMRGKSVNEVCDILSRMTGTLTFLIVPSLTPPTPLSQRRDVLIHVRAHFDYDPEDDIYVPCRELGIAFGKGDILHVINQDDPNWWQAHREGEEDQALAGLIPSKSFQEQREAVKQTLLGETENREKAKKGTLLCAKTHKKKKKKIPYSTAFNDDFDAEEIPTYEEVALYYPRASFKRPVVLIGPPNIGRHELRQRLMQESDRFAAAVPHTSRPRKDGEVDGQDYHFISRAQFESDILARRFVEHGEFEKAYYGTSLEAIWSVVNHGKICVLNLHPQSLKILRTSDLKPYIVFVAPPPLERLKQMRISRGEAYKEEELIDIIEKAREMEEKYGHYFDLVIINNDIERTYHELVQRINYIEREPQWVPAFWLKQ